VENSSRLESTLPLDPEFPAEGITIFHLLRWALVMPVFLFTFLLLNWFNVRLLGGSVFVPFPFLQNSFELSGHYLSGPMLVFVRFFVVFALPSYLAVKTAPRFKLLVAITLMSVWFSFVLITGGLAFQDSIPMLWSLERWIRFFFEISGEWAGILLGCTPAYSR
jgi:hypothetical protein